MSHKSILFLPNFEALRMIAEDIHQFYLHSAAFRDLVSDSQLRIFTAFRKEDFLYPCHLVRNSIQWEKAAVSLDDKDHLIGYFSGEVCLLYVAYLLRLHNIKYFLASKMVRDRLSFGVSHPFENVSSPEKL